MALPPVTPAKLALAFIPVGLLSLILLVLEGPLQPPLEGGGTLHG
jgi:hypothetical protein